MIRLHNNSGRKVRPVGMSPQCTLIIMCAYSVWADVAKEHNLAGPIDLRITSLGDGVHSTTSLHYRGDAPDFGLVNDGHDEYRLVLLKESLSLMCPDFDVVLEADHFHVEYQPRKL